MRTAGFVSLASVLLVAGCGAAPKLASKPAEVPMGVDLSGHWLLHENSGSNQRSARDTEVHVFLETGKSIKITQTASALFVSFDRSIVEEYPFGENRKVSVGPIDADRVSGWEGNAYVIETLDKEGALLIDSYRLGDDGRTLRRSITIRDDHRQQMSIEQTFDRI